MRSLRNLGVVVLLMAAASGCAGMQSRVAWPSQPSDEPGQSRVASWLKSRSWFRSGPASATASSNDADSRKVETASRSAPENDIWPEQRAPRLSRLFPWFGRRDSDKSAIVSGGASANTSASIHGSGYGDRWVDGQVKPVAGEQFPSVASAGPVVSAVPNGIGQPATTAIPPSPGPSPAVTLYAPPQPSGNVALEVAPADLPQSEAPPAGSTSEESASALKRRLEDPLVKAAGETGTGDSASDQPPAGKDTNPPPPIEPGPARTPATPPQGTPAAKPATAPQPPPSAASPLGPAPPITPAPAQATPTTPPAPAAAPTPTPTASTATPKQASEQPPTAEPAPASAAAPAPAQAATAQAPQGQTSTARQGQAVAAAPTPQAAVPAAVAGGSLIPSPQSGPVSPVKQTKAPYKQCALFSWLHSWHHPTLPAEPCGQLPPLAYPTSYLSCSPPAPCACPIKARPVLASPQAAPVTAPCVAKGPSKSCFSWLHKGMLSEFFGKMRSCHCSCPCHNAPVTLKHQGCKPCGSPAGSGKCGGIAYPWASPQASPTAPAAKGQAAQASLGTETGDVAQGDQVLERLSTKGLDESPQR